jgi:hypothetical protein
MLKTKTAIQSIEYEFDGINEITEQFSKIAQVLVISNLAIAKAPF